MGDDEMALEGLKTDPQTTAPLLFAKDIADVSPYTLEWAFKDYMPQDRLLQAQVVNALISSGVISKTTARGSEFVHLDNPAQEESLLLTEQITQLVMQNPQLLQLLAQQALDTNRPELAALAKMLGAAPYAQIQPPGANGQPNAAPVGNAPDGPGPRMRPETPQEQQTEMQQGPPPGAPPAQQGA